MNIWLVIAAAAVGSIMGDNLATGSASDTPMSSSFVTAPHWYVGRAHQGRQYLFQKHGGKVVFLGRFVALCAFFAAFLAGVNRMRWARVPCRKRSRRSPCGPSRSASAAYFFGKLLFQLPRGCLPALFSPVALCAFFGIGYLIHRYEHDSLKRRNQALSGPT